MYVRRTARFIVGAFMAAFVMVWIGLGAASAQAPTPAQVLQQNPNGGQLLINALEQLLRADPTTARTVLALVPSMNDQQKIAAATAVTQFDKNILVLTNAAAAADLQQLILAITDPVFKAAALNAFGDVKLGGVGEGELGGPLGGPAGGPGTGSPAQDIRSNPVNTGPFTFGAGTGTLGFVGGVVTNAANPASPSTSITVIGSPTPQ